MSKTTNYYYTYNAFIREAMRDRRETVLTRGRVDKTQENLFEQFVDLCCECWIPPHSTAKSLVDNRIINGRTDDYKWFVADFMPEFYETHKNTNPENRTEEELYEIEDKMRDKGFYYDRENFLFHTD